MSLMHLRLGIFVWRTSAEIRLRLCLHVHYSRFCRRYGVKCDLHWFFLQRFKANEITINQLKSLIFSESAKLGVYVLRWNENVEYRWNSKYEKIDPESTIRFIIRGTQKLIQESADYCWNIRPQPSHVFRGCFKPNPFRKFLK